jgi:hypothetical protein
MRRHDVQALAHLAEPLGRLVAERSERATPAQLQRWPDEPPTGRDTPEPRRPIVFNWKKLADKANTVVQKRGGPKSVEEDASELADIARGDGTLSDKAKLAAKALKEPGAHQQASAATTDPHS